VVVFVCFPCGFFLGFFFFLFFCWGLGNLMSSLLFTAFISLIICEQFLERTDVGQHDPQMLVTGRSFFPEPSLSEDFA